MSDDKVKDVPEAAKPEVIVEKPVAAEPVKEPASEPVKEQPPAAPEPVEPPAQEEPAVEVLPYHGAEPSGV